MQSVHNHRPNILKQNNILLILTSLFTTATIVLTCWVILLMNRELQLEELSKDQRIRLAEEIERITPQIYQNFPISGKPLFYHMKPNTRYEKVYGSTFITNDLGFRTIPTSPKTHGIKRIVVVGDSWTFGAYVNIEDTFTHKLQIMLNRDRETWEVYNLAMLGWNTENELAALRILLPKLKPDVVVICPTSNDIDDSFNVWRGRLVYSGFSSGAIFRYSHEYEKRWVEVFKKLQHEVEFLEGQGIKTLIYFLAEWRKLAPYYAALAGFKAKYTVVPTDYIEARYRLADSIDPGRHASPDGHELIAVYLYNALLSSGITHGMAPIGTDHEVVFPGDQYSRDEVEAELGFWWKHALRPDLIYLDDGYMAREGFFSVVTKATDKTISVKLHLIDEPALYPLTVTLEVASLEAVRQQIVIDRYTANPHPVTLAKPKSLNRYPIIEIRVKANRISTLSNKLNPISMKRPEITVD